MEIKIFKPNDKVILTDQGDPIGWEKEDYTGNGWAELSLGHEYTINTYFQDCNGDWAIDLKECNPKGYTDSYYVFHPNHFTLKEEVS